MEKQSTRNRWACVRRVGKKNVPGAGLNTSALKDPPARLGNRSGPDDEAARQEVCQLHSPHRRHSPGEQDEEKVPPSMEVR